MKTTLTLLTILTFSILSIDSSFGQAFAFPQGLLVPDNGPSGNSLILTTEVTGVGELDNTNGAGLGFIYFDMDHSYTGDIIAKVTSPEGTAVTFINQVGGSGDDFSNTHIVSWNTGTPIGSATAPFTGDFEPSNSISTAFDGEWADGTWTLEISDTYAGDQGLLNLCYLQFDIKNRYEFQMINIDFNNGDGDNKAYAFAHNTVPLDLNETVDDLYGTSGNNYGNAYHFDGNSSLDFAYDSPDWNVSSQLTMAAWVKPDAINGTRAIMGKSDGTSNNLYFLGLYNGEYHAEVKFNGNTYQLFGGTAEIGKWAHVAVIFYTYGNMHLYVNGSQVATTTTGISPITNLYNLGNWRLGAAPFDPNFYKFSGVVDDIEAWNIALDPTDMRRLASSKNSHYRSAIEVPVIGTSCTAEKFGQNYYAFNSSSSNPGCANYNGGDNWYSVTIPISGNVVIEATSYSGQNTFSNTGMSVYSESGGSLFYEDCDDNSGSGNHAQIELNGRTPGEKLYVRIWENGNDAFGLFGVCAHETASTIGISEEVQIDLSLYPNPSLDGNFTIDFDGELKQIQVIDALGRTLKTPIDLNAGIIDGSSLSNGSYIVRITTNEGISTKQIIISK